MSVAKIELPYDPEEESKNSETRPKTEQAGAKILPFKKERAAARKTLTAGETYEKKLAELRSQLETVREEKAGNQLGERIEKALLKDIEKLESKLARYRAAQEKVAPLREQARASRKKPSAEVEESLAEIKKLRRPTKKEKEYTATGATMSGKIETTSTVAKEEPKEKVRLAPEAVFSKAEEEWFKKGEELEQGEPTSTLPTSLEPYLAAIKKMNIPDFDYEQFENLVRRQHKLEEEVADMESGALKVGFFKRWKMQRELNKITDQLHDFQEKIDMQESVQIAQKGFKK